MIQSLRGMNDVIFEDSERFTFFIQTATKIAKNYGFTLIETPILEETALFKRSVGESSDIVGKEMYQFLDKGDNDVCLRPEGTAGVVRAFIQKKLDKAGGKHKHYYHGPMFRYERPQKGRLRQFHQFGAESFGEASVLEDTSMIMMVCDIFKAVGIEYTLEINSLGCPECMPTYRNTLVDFVQAHKSTICEDCLRRVGINPIRVLDCKNETCQTIYTQAPKLTDKLCKSCDDDFSRLKTLLDHAGIAYTINTNLVRGLDYYSKTAFEFVSSGIGAQNAIAGGGRYDRLVEFLEGKPTPAVGFAIGIERILELIVMPNTTREGYYFGALDDENIATLFTLGTKKRHDAKVHIEYERRSLKKHLQLADKVNAIYCVIVGENERKENKVWVKNLQTKEEQTLFWADL